MAVAHLGDEITAGVLLEPLFYQPIRARHFSWVAHWAATHAHHKTIVYKMSPSGQVLSILLLHGDAEKNVVV